MDHIGQSNNSMQRTALSAALMLNVGRTENEKELKNDLGRIGARMSVTIRRAVQRDEAALAQLSGMVQALHVATRPDIFVPVNPDDLVDWFRAALTNRTHAIWLAEIDGVPVGYLPAVIHDRPAHREPRLGAGVRLISSAWPRACAGEASPADLSIPRSRGLESSVLPEYRRNVGHSMARLRRPLLALTLDR